MHRLGSFNFGGLLKSHIWQLIISHFDLMYVMTIDSTVIYQLSDRVGFFSVPTSLGTFLYIAFVIPQIIITNILIGDEYSEEIIICQN